MSIYNEHQQSLAKRIEDDVVISKWKDWRWQMKHRVKDIDTFEKLLGIKLKKNEREDLEKT